MWNWWGHHESIEPVNTRNASSIGTATVARVCG
jgi:hypothetical protein